MPVTEQDYQYLEQNEQFKKQLPTHQHQHANNSNNNNSNNATANISNSNNNKNFNHSMPFRLTQQFFVLLKSFAEGFSVGIFGIMKESTFGLLQQLGSPMFSYVNYYLFYF